MRPNVTPILTTHEVMMNEEREGRYAIPSDLLDPADELIDTPQYIRLHHGSCPQCSRFQRHLEGYKSIDDDDTSYYAACNHCGNRERL